MQRMWNREWMEKCELTTDTRDSFISTYNNLHQYSCITQTNAFSASSTATTATTATATATKHYISFSSKPSINFSQFSILVSEGWHLVLQKWAFRWRKDKARGDLPQLKSILCLMVNCRHKKSTHWRDKLAHSDDRCKRLWFSNLFASNKCC